MGFSIKEWIIGKLGGNQNSGFLTSGEISEIAEEIQVRELAFNVCVNMIANAIGKCDFKTYSKNKSVENEEYWTWNIEPNKGQNSTEFLHKLIYQLYRNNEALIVGDKQLWVADDFHETKENPDREKRYEGVCVGEKTYNIPIPESEVLHFKLNHEDIKPIVNGLYSAYKRLIIASMKNHTWGSGNHIKVHINRMAQGDEEFQRKYKQIIDQQLKPYLNSTDAVLPEFDGYSYENFGGNKDAQRGTRDIRALVDDVFSFTANAFGIPPVLILGSVEGTKDAIQRWLTVCIDPLCDQLQEEITRKRYGLEAWKKGDYLRIDTSTIMHFDMFDGAAGVEKLIGSGAYSINDVRKAAGKEEIDEEWANQHWLTLNIESIQSAAMAIDTKKEGGNEE